MNRAHSISEIMSKKFKVLQWSQPWKDAFLQPEISGLWFVWGNSSNGKTSFVMQMAKEFSTLGIGKVFINSTEEGARLTMQNNIKLNGLSELKNKVIINNEPLEKTYERLSKHKSPHFIFIDSVQASGANKATFRKLLNSYPNKLFIVTSQTKGRHPIGDTAMSLKHDADMKYFVEGFKAFSNGRLNPGGEYVIWEEKATEYWSVKHQKQA